MLTCLIALNSAGTGLLGIALAPWVSAYTMTDIADLVRFLLPARSAWITGQLRYSSCGYPKVIFHAESVAQTAPVEGVPLIVGLAAHVLHM